MIGFETKSGSTYEVDVDGRKIRRLTGQKDPQPRQGKDGEWKPFKEVGEIELGRPVAILWDPKTTPLHAGSPSEATPATITSPVVRCWVRT